MLCASLVEIAPVVLEKQMKTWKVNDNNDDDNDDDDGQRTNFDQKGSLELKSFEKFGTLQSLVRRRVAFFFKIRLEFPSSKKV